MSPSGGKLMPIEKSPPRDSEVYIKNKTKKTTTKVLNR